MQRRILIHAAVALLFVAACFPAAPATAQSVSSPAKTSGTVSAPAKPATTDGAGGGDKKPKSAVAKAVSGYVVVDLTTDPKDPDATQVVAFDAKTAGEAASSKGCQILTNGTPAIGDVGALAACAGNSQALLKDRLAAAEGIRVTARASAKAGTTRFISSKGDLVRVVVIAKAQAFVADDTTPPVVVRGTKPTVSFKEKARETQIATDLKSLVPLAAGILSAEAGVTPDGLPDPAKAKAKDVTWAFVSSHGLRQRRATTSIAVEGGQAMTILAKPPAATDEAVVLFLERWEAAQTPTLDCTKVLASPRATALVILQCRAKEGTTTERLAAIDGMGTLGDVRALPILRQLSDEKRTSERPEADAAAVRIAALTALSKLKAAAPAPAPTAPEKAGDAKEAPPKPSVDLITGPREHWYLSADVPITSLKDLKLAGDSGEVGLADTPSAFYLGINFLGGDLKDPNRSFLGNLVFKGLLKASKRPLDSYGVAIGLRGQYLSKLGLNLDVLTPFVAYTRTRQTVDEADAAAGPARLDSRFQVGVSLNLDQAVKWLGGK